MICKNGQTQETSRRLNSSDIFDQSERLGRFQDSSRVNGIEQVRPDQVDCSTQDKSRRTSKHRDSTAGKILERLKSLENKHISHLKSHQDLLKSQFDQIKDEEESFRKEVQELEEEIYNLVSSEGKSQPPSEECIQA
ncbi:hypothetical protein FACHB389_15070 [Nostoc calcicola FACHB-389]|nr:hypothetical protein [Nostoc calcicola FACHB-3891]OKH34649.1 hypothetical protein FACHB389_15070 [Nostoc calcicola FACHB-389]